MIVRRHLKKMGMMSSEIQFFIFFGDSGRKPINFSAVLPYKSAMASRIYTSLLGTIHAVILMATILGVDGSKASEVLNDSSPKSDQYFLAAQKLTERGQYLQAHLLIKEALSFNPDHVGSLILSAKLSIIENQDDKALAYLDHAESLLLPLNGPMAEERLLIAESYVALQHYADADEQLTAILDHPKLDVNSFRDQLFAARAFTQFAAIYTRQQNIRKAQAHFLGAERLISKLDPSARSVWKVKNEWLSEISKLEELRGDLESAASALHDLLSRQLDSDLSEHDDTADTALRLGTVYRNDNKPHLAERFYRFATNVLGEIFGADHPETIKANRLLQELRRSAI